MIAQYSLGYHFYAFFKMADAKTKVHVAAKIIFSWYYFQNDFKRACHHR